MRTVLAIVLAIVMLFVGFHAISMSADQTEDPAVTNGTNASSDAWNLTTKFTEGMGSVLTPALAYGGAGAIVLLALGYAVAAGGRGR